MPGLNQLKTFSEKARELGDEVKIRAQRGEKTPSLPLPQGISEDDDSDDFILGMPEVNPEDSDAETEQVDTLEDISADESGDIDVGNLDSILDPQISADEDALADFLSDDLGSVETLDSDDSKEEKTEETPLEDLGLDDLLKTDDTVAASASSEGISADSSLETPDINEALSNLGDLTDFAQNAPSDTETSLDDISNIDIDMPVENENSSDSNLDLGSFDIDSLISDNPGEAGAESGETAEVPMDESVSDMGEIAADLPSFDENPESAEQSESGPQEDGLQTEETASADSTSSQLDDLGELGDFNFETESTGSEGSAEVLNDSASDSEISLADSDTLPDMDSSIGGMDIDSLVSGEETVPDTASEFPDSVNLSGGTEGDAPIESFDTSAMEGVDFGPSKPASGDEFPATDDTLGGDDDFILDSNFEIPGFSDTETADLGKKAPVLDTVDFSKGKEDRPKNSLTEEEYIQFKKNLSNYPLNLRIALEDFIARDEFTDDAVFEIIEKVLKKTSARQLATQLEKILDISINIPRDFERRSFAEYEAYKQSFQYQLKNRIIPAAIVGVILVFVCIGLFKAGVHFIYNPVMANIHYKQGYTLLEANEFPQSEQEFQEAVRYRAVKKWFFKYAYGYRERKQYERAAQMYKRILAVFNHDKQAGLDYASMELYDRANYERAEEIVRREILDYHINDADGMLMLGDVFLEWAEVDPSKYELAKNQYLDLIQRYGENNIYLSRMLRYNIRTDKLREVLFYKNIFYVSKQDKQNLKNLSADDWTELSGYLLDKLYGTLSKNDEYLRSSIEDVLAMLNLAIKANPANPVARYNLSRYFIQNGNTEQAKIELERSLDLFENVEIRTKKNVYREINATRILGELYAANHEYLKAQTVYTRGINLYNEEHETSALEGDANTGKLFADMGDLDYFVSGEMDDALYNYEKAIEIKNDTPSINFRVGSIYYNRKNYDNALASFIKVVEKNPKDPNVLLSLGNVLSIRGDNFTAESYYADLLSVLDSERSRQKYLLPQDSADDFEIVDLYLKANNNLGVTLYRLANQTGNSAKNAEALVRLSDSIRAWDALTRNPDTMVRLEGSNLAAQNSKYITHPYPDFEPAIYTDIPKLLFGEKELD